MQVKKQQYSDIRNNIFTTQTNSEENKYIS